jgi:hypothetical protein
MTNITSKTHIHNVNHPRLTPKTSGIGNNVSFTMKDSGKKEVKRNGDKIITNGNFSYGHWGNCNQN